MGKSLLIVFHFLIEDLASVIARVELLNSMCRLELHMVERVGHEMK